MLARIYPNSEIELVSSIRVFPQRRDIGKPKPRLDIELPVHTKKISRLKSGEVAGFGRLHRGKGNFRRGVSRRIQRLGGALDEYAADKGLSRAFITLTCPGSTREAVEAFSAWSGYILDSLNKWLAEKQYRKNGVRQFMRLHSWEVQKRGAEHLHYVCCLSTSVFISVKGEIRAWWHNLLLRVSKMSSVDIFARVNGGGTWRERPDVLQIKVEEVEKSVSAYLSKYLRKNLNIRVAGFATYLIPRPARLWGASRCLKRHLQSVTTSLFWNLAESESVELLCAMQELAQRLCVKYSMSSWAGGLTVRMRCFFSGNRAALNEFSEYVVRLASSMKEKPLRNELRIADMTRLFKKAVRIQADNKKRVAFYDLYGEIMSKELANWASTIEAQGFQRALLYTCLEDFDEVTLGSLMKLAKLSKPKEQTIQQLSLRLFTPRG